MTRRRAALCLLGGPALLAGCGAGLWPKATPGRVRYTLEAGQSPAPAGAAARDAPALVVALPQPLPGQDSTHMLYQRHAQELEAYAYAEWAATPAAMLAPLLVRALQQTGAFSAVLLAPAGTPGAWHLACEFVSLHQDFGAVPSRARLGLRAVLQGGTPRRVLAWRDFEQAAAAPTEDAAGGAAAANQAAIRLVATVATWCAMPASTLGWPR
jgi:cholesterol transport system auxiliary component